VIGWIFEVPFEMGLGTMIHIPGFIRTGSGIQKFIEGILRQRHSKVISLI
jgi:hypothetical protein